MTTILISKSRFRIKEMKIYFQWQIRHIFVVHTIALIAHITILQIAIQDQFLFRTINNAPIGFGIYIRIGLFRVVAVILIVYRQNQAIFQIMQRTKVITHIMVSGTTQLHIDWLRNIFRRQHGAKEMIIKLLTIHTIYLVRIRKSPI